MTDPRIGQHGEYKPTQTICGNDATQPYGMTIGLGGNFYCVIDTFPACDWQTTLAELKAKVRPKKRKVHRPDES